MSIKKHYHFLVPLLISLTSFLFIQLRLLQENEIYTMDILIVSVVSIVTTTISFFVYVYFSTFLIFLFCKEDSILKKVKEFLSYSFSFISITYAVSSTFNHFWITIFMLVVAYIINQFILFKIIKPYDSRVAVVMILFMFLLSVMSIPLLMK